MATLQDRPFAKDYSGLVNQTVIAGVIFALGTVSFEVMKRKRRGRKERRAKDRMGSVETWEFGYLYNGRAWSRNPSPPSGSKWPIYSWVKQAIRFPEAEFFRLRGLDATLYCRILRGCVYFCLLQSVTTFPILLPIHILFSTPVYARKSLLRASISSLTGTSGERFFAFHVILSYWLVLTWTLTLLWCARGLFRYRSQSIQEQIIPASDQEKFNEAKDVPNRGLRWRTIMVTNIPVPLRDEKNLKEYFEYYMSRPLSEPLTPTMYGKVLSFFFRRAKQTAAHLLPVQDAEPGGSKIHNLPEIERVVVVRKLTDLASLLSRREEVLRKLELAHLKLAKKALEAVKVKLDEHPPLPLMGRRKLWQRSKKQPLITPEDMEQPFNSSEDEALIRTLEPFVHEFDVPCTQTIQHTFQRLRHILFTRSHPSRRATCPTPTNTIWEALYSLPRHLLDPYQPLIRLNSLFLGSTVPAIDYYSTKLGLLTNLIEEKRSQPPSSFTPASTAFVSFHNPHDAARACKYLASHPEKPLACLTVPAPDVMDLDWDRVMKSAFTGEWIKDWVVSLGVWAFTCLWIIPVSLFVSLVSISNIATFIPSLKTFLDHHVFLENLISNLLPTLLVSILAILIPLILLLIAKKANLILTYSGLHDRIMIRYHKFLVCNLLVFFCVGVAALESALTAFKNPVDPVQLIAQSYPTAGPFYVGWLIFTTGIHAGLELGLIGLPLIVYPSTRKTPLPRKRALGIRPRTLNYYYWLPNHVFVMFLLLVFSVLNPLIIPFSLTYFAVEAVIIKNQLLHVYAKAYEGNGRNLLIRFSRYSMDGLVLEQVVLFAFLLLNKKVPHAVFMALLIALTVIAKLYLTRLFNRKFVEADILEAEVSCGIQEQSVRRSGFEPSMEDSAISFNSTRQSRIDELGRMFTSQSAKFWTWQLPFGLQFTYPLHRPHQKKKREERQPTLPFAAETEDEKFIRLRSTESPTRHHSLDAGGSGEDHKLLADSGANRISEGADFSGATGPTVFAAPTISALDARRQGKLVTQHGPHPRWDDTPRYDMTYENPFYTIFVENFLWLPQNPYGKLDLDDTVDLHRAITCEATSEEIGKWVVEGGGERRMSSSVFDAEESPVDDVKTSLMPTGRESIVLPESIASRVPVEKDVEEAVQSRPWMAHRHSSSSPRRPNLGQRSSSKSLASKRSAIIEESQTGPDPRQRSASTSFVPMKSMSDPASHLPSLSLPIRSASVDNSIFESRLEGGDSASLKKRSRQSLVLSHQTSTLGMIHEASSVPEAAVSTQEAVIGEVLAEEQIAAQEREQREKEEREQEAKSRQGWWSGWMWKST